MGKLDTEIVERYLDGELSEKESKRMETLMNSSQESRRIAEQNKQLGELLRFSSNEMCKDVSFDGFSSRILEQVENERPIPLSTRIRVWLAEFIEHRRSIWIPATAACASAVLAVALWPSTPVNQTTVYNPQANGIALHSSVIETAGGSQIASVDFGPARGTTYSIPSSTQGTVGVVWIVENP